MTEDLHNDIDDLFRSGLEGKEDTPSPGVWSAIEKALPPAPAPLPPASSAPPAVGGSTSTIIFKGLIGAAVVAIIGTATYLFSSNKNEANTSAGNQPTTENAAIKVPVNTDQPVSATYHQERKPSASDETQAADNEVASRATLRPEFDHEARPSANPENQTALKSQETRAFTENLSVKSGNKQESGRSVSSIDITNALTIRNSVPILKAAKTANPRRGVDLVPSKRNSETAILQSSLPSANNTANSSLSEWKVAHTNALIERKGNTLSSSISTPTTIPYSVIPFLGRISSTETSGPADKSEAAKLKRNNWTSRIYLIPGVSLNMTTMHVEENKSFGPRIGREHIEFKETEQTKTTVSPGIMAGFAISPRISVQTGISEYRNNIDVSPKQIKAVRDRDGKVRYRLDCSSGSYFLDPKAGTAPTVGDSLRISSSEIRMRYVTIPMSVRVNFGNDKVKIFATAGTDFNVLAGKQTSTSLSPASGEKVNPVRTEGTRKQYLNGTVGAGIEIKAGKRLGIMLMPQYRFPMGNMNEDGPVLTYPKTFSVTSGIRIGF